MSTARPTPANAKTTPRHLAVDIVDLTCREVHDINGLVPGVKTPEHSHARPENQRDRLPIVFSANAPNDF